MMRGGGFPSRSKILDIARCVVLSIVPSFSFPLSGGGRGIMHPLKHQDWWEKVTLGIIGCDVLRKEEKQIPGKREEMGGGTGVVKNMLMLGLGARATTPSLEDSQAPWGELGAPRVCPSSPPTLSRWRLGHCRGRPGVSRHWASSAG